MATAPYSYVTDGTSLDRDDFFERVRTFVRDQMLRACASTSAVSSSTPPIVIGFQAPQGFGKTFLLNRLKMELGAEQLLTLSLDDFYFPAEQLTELASENPSYWGVRGLPGTHDVQLLRAVLETVVTRGGRARSLASGGEGEEKGEDTSLLLPRFDKTLRGGRGDRIADGRCQRLSASQLQSIRVVLLEGWCVGFSSSDRRSAPAAANANGGSVEQRQAEAGEVDLDPLYEQGPATRLREQYEAVWREFISAWVIVELPLEAKNLFGSNSARALRWVVDWRQEAERKQSEATGREMMTAEEVEKFCEPYLACYRRCLPQLYEMGEALATRQASADAAKNILRAVIQNEKRLVICLDEG